MSPNPFPNLRPVCPVDLLPEPLLSAVRYATCVEDVPAAIALTDALGAAGAVVHCGFDCVDLRGRRMASTINTVAACPSAVGKGTSMKIFYKHLLDSIESSALDEDDSQSSTVAGSPRPKQVPLVENVMTMATRAGLMTELYGRGMTVAFLREEGASFLETDLFKSNTDVLTQLWSGSPPIVDRVRHGKKKATDARCSFGFRIQPELFYESLSQGGMTKYRLGFWPRCIAGCHDPVRFPWNSTYVRSMRTPGLHPRAFQERVVELAAQINQHHRNGFAGRVGVRLDDQAKAFMLELGYRIKRWIEEWYSDIREAAGRAWENTLRIAVVLHVFCRQQGNVGLDLVECAWQIVQWSLSQHQLIFVDAIRELRAKPATRQLAPLQLAKPIKLARIPRSPRPIKDAKFLLYCMQRLPYRVGGISVEELNKLASLPPKQLDCALEWLKLERMLVVREIEGVRNVRFP